MIRSGRQLLRPLANLIDLIRRRAARRRGKLFFAAWHGGCPHAQPWESIKTAQQRKAQCPCDAHLNLRNFADAIRQSIETTPPDHCTKIMIARETKHGINLVEPGRSQASDEPRLDDAAPL